MKRLESTTWPSENRITQRNCGLEIEKLISVTLNICPASETTQNKLISVEVPEYTSPHKKNIIQDVQPLLGTTADRFRVEAATSAHQKLRTQKNLGNEARELGGANYAETQSISCCVTNKKK